jgi:hypothetical protein
MPKPVVVRPATGNDIYVHHIRRSSVLYLLRGSRLQERSVQTQDDDSVRLPRARLAEIVNVLAHDRGLCEVLLHYRDDEQCTVSCQEAAGPVEDCTCRCGGSWHGGGALAWQHVIPGTEGHDSGGVIRIPGGQLVRRLAVRRGGPDFHATLQAAITADRLNQPVVPRP